jgi:hypothetical protein
MTRSYSQKAATFYQNISPLFKLPQELRDEIYRYILASPELLLICQAPPPEKELFTSHCTQSQEDPEKDEYRLLLQDEDVPHTPRSDPKILALLLSCRRVFVSPTPITC